MSVSIKQFFPQTAIKSIQRGSQYLIHDQTYNITINAVDINKSIVVISNIMGQLMGYDSPGVQTPAGAGGGNITAGGKLTSATNLRIISSSVFVNDDWDDSGNYGTTCYWQVIEYV